MVRWLMHTTQKVNEELEVLQHLQQQRIVRAIRDRRERVGGSVGQERTDVLYGVEDDVAIATHPAVRAGELAIVDAFGEVQYGPGSACIVGLGGRHKVRRVVVRSRAFVSAVIAIRIEDGADGY